MGGSQFGLHFQESEKMRVIISIVIITFFLSCNKKELFNGVTSYSDDFESYNHLEDLLVDNDVNWSFTQLTRENNGIVVSDTFAHSGTKSLRFDAKASSEEASKASIAKQNFAFWEGERIKLSAWYYIEGEATLDWLFLLDLEERTPIGAGPGMRLALVDNQLLVEHKYNEPNITQTESVDFPRNQWVHVEWEVFLSQKEEGFVRVWQNGQLIITRDNHRTLPKDLLYFQQGTKGQYNSCEIGVTANSKNNTVRLWVDDISFNKIN